MWRCDARRSAACSEELPERLGPTWTWELAGTAPAWPNESRLHFDVCYEPVVVGHTVLIASPNDGSVMALDSESGRRRWTFFTEGPVRFAPVAWRDKVYVGSDDGHLYCLNLADGGLRWKVRGAPEDRPHCRHLGNNRLISFWPVRGGPVVADGVLYFAAGIWPTLGVFVAAVDAETGRLLWRNGDVSYIEKVRLDHNVIGDSGLSPQGYLAVEGDTLLVPNGRSMPAGLDRKTGKLLYYIQGYRNGACQVTVMGKYAFVGRAGVVNTQTGREVGSRWAAAGADAPKGFDSQKFHLFEGPIHPYKTFAGCSWQSALVPGIAYDLEAGTFAARDLDRADVAEFASKIMGRSVKPWRWDAPTLWTLPTDLAPKKPKSSALIRAGHRLYGHTGNTLMAVDLPASAGQRPKLAWTQPLSGTPGSLLAANGKLFVVTREGQITCFGDKKVSQPLTLRPSRAQAPSYNHDRWDPIASQLLVRSKTVEGYCLVLGLVDGGLVQALLQQSRLKMIVVDRDHQRIDQLRQRLIDQGEYGVRAELFVGDPATFGAPPWLASLIVNEMPSADCLSYMPRLLEWLHPYGGIACLKGADQDYAAYHQREEAARAEKVRIERSHGFVTLVREGPLPGSAPWTHESADAARTFFSRDQRIKQPLGVLWYGDGPDHGFFKEHDYGTGVKPQVVGGRVFALQIHTNTLHAYDAYNGRLLWKKPVDRFTRYASLEDGIYVAGGGRCEVLDPASGESRASFKLEGDEGRPVFVSDIRVADDVILVAVANEKVRVIEKGLWDSTLLLALDRKTGKTLWKHKAKERFNNSALATGAGLVFAIDSLSPIETEKTKRRGQTDNTTPATIMALDARSGQVKWSQVNVTPYRVYPQEHWTGIQGNDDWLAYSREHNILLTGKQSMAWAFDATSGRQLWSKRIGGSQPWMLRGQTFVHQGGTAFDIATGKPIGVQFPLVRGGCNYAVASQHLLLLRSRSVRCVDAATAQPQDLFAVRSGCSNSLIAADGLLNVPCFAVGCVCNYPIQTSFAMFHLPEAAAWAKPAKP